MQVAHVPLEGLSAGHAGGSGVPGGEAGGDAALPLNGDDAGKQAPQTQLPDAHVSSAGLATTASATPTQ